MKKLYSLVAVCSIAAASYAQTVVASDDFSYDGLLTANGWAHHSGTNNQLAANGGKAQLKSTDTEDVNKAFTAPFTIDASALNKIEYTAKVNVLNGTGLASSGDYFLSLGTTSGTSVNVLPARLYVKPGATANTYILGVLNTSGGTVTPTWDVTEIPFGTEANIKVVFEVNTADNTQVAKLTVNGGTEVSNSTGTGSAPAVIQSVALRQGTANNGTGNVTIDDLVVTAYPPTVLAISDLTATKKVLVKNTNIQDEVTFGAKSNDVKVFNMLGQVVKTASVKENETLNVSDLKAGSYIVTGTVANEAVSQKVIKN